MIEVLTLPLMAFLVTLSICSAAALAISAFNYFNEYLEDRSREERQRERLRLDSYEKTLCAVRGEARARMTRGAVDEAPHYRQIVKWIDQVIK